VKKTFIVLFTILAGIIGYFIGRNIPTKPEDTTFVSTTSQKPLEKYTIENLAKTDIKEGKFEMGTKLASKDDYTSYLFHFNFNPVPDSVLMKKTEGQINLPVSADSKKLPIIIMLRGYINQEIYKAGDGTRNTSDYFAKNSFITIAPDFLGYGGSDKEAENIFESRFQTYVTVLSLIKSLDQIPGWDGKNIFIWGHSNGGQIALTIMEITGGNYPTTLWAPVSKYFPYSVLFYTDTSEDRGKLIRSELTQFEKIYDTEKYSLDNYLDKINAPIQIQQGTSDTAVPYQWTDQLVKNLEKLDKNIKLIKYAGTDHNMQPSWDNAVQADLEFFLKNII